MTQSRVLVALVLCISLLSAPSFAAVKAGGKCTKAGTTLIAAGKKFTCVKSGTKLVWNKGVADKAAPKPSATLSPGQKAETKNILSSDLRITPVSALTSLNTCKIEDQTPGFMPDGSIGYGNGFPRPTFSVYGRKSAKVLVVPMSFKNLPFTDQRSQSAKSALSDVEQLNQVIPSVIDRFNKLSNQRFKMTIDVLPKSEWWVINRESPFNNVWGSANDVAIQGILDQEKKDFDFGDYDTVLFTTGSSTFGENSSFAGAASYVKAKNSKSGYASIVYLVGGLSRTNFWVHEFGHSLFGLEDLYLYSQAAKGGSLATNSGAFDWDLMADTNRDTLLEWNRFLMGWLNDSEVRCVDEQKSTVHYLTIEASSVNPKLLTIKLAPGVLVAAEAKPGSSSTIIEGSRLLLYTIDTNKNGGDEPIFVQNSMLSKGQSRSFLGWKFNVLDSDDNGLIVEAIKTDIDKFVPPAPKPRPEQPAPQATKIRVVKGEVVSTGSLKARATWNVNGHESYRVFVVAADDAQKVFFETGIRNGSQNPLVVEISGLPCNREVRVTTMFFSEKDGKGERLVRDNKDLGILSCEDTTKKP